MGVHTWNPSARESEIGRVVLGTCSYTNLIYLVSFRPMRDPDSKVMDHFPEDDAHGFHTYEQIYVCTCTYTRMYIKEYTYIIFLKKIVNLS